MAKLVYSYHNKDHSTTSFRGLYQHFYTKRFYFFVDVDGHTGLIEYYTRIITYMNRPGPEFIKVNNFSYARALLDAHNAQMRSLMQTCNQSIEIQQLMYDGQYQTMSMADVLSQAFITYHGQTF